MGRDTLVVAYDDGNNLFGEEMKTALQTLSREQRSGAPIGTPRLHREGDAVELMAIPLPLLQGVDERLVDRGHLVFKRPQSRWLPRVLQLESARLLDQHLLHPCIELRNALSGDAKRRREE